MIPMSSASRLYHLWQHFGPRWLAHRVGYAARLRSGAIAWRLPARAWQAQPLEQFLKDCLSTVARIEAHGPDQANEEAPAAEEPEASENGPPSTP